MAGNLSATGRFYLIGALIFLAIALLLVVGVVFAPPSNEDVSSDVLTTAKSPAPLVTAGSSDTIDREKDKEEIPQPVIPPDPACSAAIAGALAELGRAKTPAEAAEILQRLREFLSRAQEQEAAAAVVAFLRTGQDAPTGLPFDVGAEGVLDSPPSLRVMLLDMLPSLDPYASVEVARQVIADGNSQDEYAVALRNLAWNDLDGDMASELSAAFISMTERDDWRANPSAGFLEAFDISVQVGGTKMLDQVANSISAGTSDAARVVNRAAFMALDRIVLRDPSVLVTKFSEDPGFLSQAPRQRASVMSRLDIEQSAQRDLFVHYLESMNHAEGELEYFSGLFPNGNYLHGHRLVTAEETTPTIDQRQEMDRRILTVLESIEAELAGDSARSAVATIARRLEGFLAPKTVK